MNFIDKLKALSQSRRFYALLSGVVLMLAEELFGVQLDPDTVKQIVLLIMAWIVGDSINKTR
mgnify:FL=1